MRKLLIFFYFILGIILPPHPGIILAVATHDCRRHHHPRIILGDARGSSHHPDVILEHPGGIGAERVKNGKWPFGEFWALSSWVTRMTHPTQAE